jgi:hypothetical protein
MPIGLVRKLTRFMAGMSPGRFDLASTDAAHGVLRRFRCHPLPPPRVKLVRDPGSAWRDGIVPFAVEGGGSDVPRQFWVGKLPTLPAMPTTGMMASRSVPAAQPLLVVRWTRLQARAEGWLATACCSKRAPTVMVRWRVVSTAGASPSGRNSDSNVRARRLVGQAADAIRSLRARETRHWQNRCQPPPHSNHSVDEIHGLTLL